MKFCRTVPVLPTAPGVPVDPAKPVAPVPPWYSRSVNSQCINEWNTPVCVMEILRHEIRTLLCCNRLIATRLRGDGIFNGQFFTQSVMSPTVKESQKSVNICRSYGQESSVLFVCSTFCATL